MTAALWAHQEDAVQFALSKMPGGAGIFLEQRCGKTRVAIEAARRMEARRILVLCPSQAGAVPLVWKREIAAQWSNAPTVTVLAGTARERATQLSRLAGRPAIVVVNHEIMWREPLRSALLAGGWDCMIIDEAHRMKSPTGKASRFAAALARSVPARMSLTGTPLPHDARDAWGLFQSLEPSVFPPSFTQFRLRYSRPAARDEQRDPDTFMVPGKGGILTRWKLINLDDLRDRIAAHSVRVLTRDVFPNMPPELDDERRVDLEPVARRAYNQMNRSMVAEVRGGVVTAANAGVKILRLTQLTGGTLVVENAETGERSAQQVSTAKEDLLAEMLRDIAEPVVVYAWFHSDLDAIHRACAAAGVSSSELSGRRSELDAWQAGETQVLAAQVRAAGTGISLVRASIVVIYSTGHISPADYAQARSRVLGPLQTKPAMFYTLSCTNTVDVDIAQARLARTDVINYVVERMRDAPD